MAQQLIESLSGEFEPEKYKDQYREKVLELIEEKAQGEEIAVAPEAPAPAKVPDLMAALEASLAAVRTDDEKPKRKSAKSTEREKAESQVARRRTDLWHAGVSRMPETGARPNVPRLQRGMLRAIEALTTPLLPSDYLELINPLWSTRELRGRIERDRARDGRRRDRA